MSTQTLFRTTRDSFTPKLMDIFKKRREGKILVKEASKSIHHHTWLQELGFYRTYKPADFCSPI